MIHRQVGCYVSHHTRSAYNWFCQCSTFCELTPICTGLSGLCGGDENQQTADWYHVMCSPGFYLSWLCALGVTWKVCGTIVDRFRVEGQAPLEEPRVGHPAAHVRCPGCCTASSAVNPRHYLSQRESRTERLPGLYSSGVHPTNHWCARTVCWGPEPIHRRKAP